LTAGVAFVLWAYVSREPSWVGLPPSAIMIQFLKSNILHLIFIGDIEFHDVNSIIVDLDNFPQKKASFDT
jgi:hypothetical protein